VTKVPQQIFGILNDDQGSYTKKEAQTLTKLNPEASSNKKLLMEISGNAS
jgi:hypothetical protein